jgi:hypothetical protein
MLEQLQADLTIIMNDLTRVCERYHFDAIPTILLRHQTGAQSSVLMSNDSAGKIVMCIAELEEIGNESSMSPHEAAMLKIFTDEAERNDPYKT